MKEPWRKISISLARLLLAIYIVAPGVVLIAYCYSSIGQPPNSAVSYDWCWMIGWALLGAGIFSLCPRPFLGAFLGAIGMTAFGWFIAWFFANYIF
jgi:hypothetical protein